MPLPSPVRPLVLAALLFSPLASHLVSAESTTMPPAKVAAVMPSEAECEAFGRKLAGLFDGGSAEEAMRLLDIFSLADRIGAGLGLSANDERDFRGTLVKDLPAALAKQFQQYSSARFLRLQTMDGERRALLRFSAESGGVNYVAFICSRRGEGPLRWSDAFMYMSGETMSQSSRRAMLPLVAQAQKGILDRLTGTESSYVQNIGAIARAMTLTQQDKMLDAWYAFEKLPPELRKDHNILILRFRAAQGLDEKKQLRVIEEWAAAYPGDPALDFVSIDADIMRKDYAGSLAHIEAFAKRLGGDPYLDFLAANTLLLAERYDEARQRARKALTAEPDLAEPYDTLLAIALKTKNHAETVTILESFQAQYPKVDASKLVADEAWDGFRESAVYREWLDKRPKPPAKKK